MGRFSDAVALARDTLNPAERPEDEFRHFSIPAYDQGQEPARDRGNSIKSQKFVVPSGSILLSKLNPEIERVWLPDVGESDDAVCSTEFLVLRPKAPYGRAFVYSLSRSRPFRRDIESLVTGTSKSHQRARPDAILAIPMLQPPERLIDHYELATNPMLQSVALDRRQSQSLAFTRDALLPRLISGALSAPGAGPESKPR